MTAPEVGEIFREVILNKLCYSTILNPQKRYFEEYIQKNVSEENFKARTSFNIT